MKFGVLGFSYSGSGPFARRLATQGHYTANLGDNAQAIASRGVYERLGVAPEDIVVIDRDTLPSYSGPPAFLVMNAVFKPRSFPLPDQITPIFVGFSAHSEAVVAENRDLFKRYETIGCRDLATLALMEAHGIAAVATGCITQTLPRRPAPPPDGRLMIVYGAGAGELPSVVLKHVPPALMDTAEMICHRQPVYEFPVSEALGARLEAYEKHLLGHYAASASLVLTPLLHVASPCLAMGIPVVLCRKSRDKRFGLIAHQTPVYLPEQVAEIDWQPPAVDVSQEADAIVEWVRGRIAGTAGAS